MWTTLLGGQTPCFSTLAEAISPAPLTAAVASNASTILPTAAVVNVAYAIHYSVSPSSSPALTTGTIAGISVGSAVGALVLLGVGVMVLLRRRDKRKIDSLKDELRTTQASTPGGLGSYETGQGTSMIPTVSSVAVGRTPSTGSALSGSDGGGRYPYMAQPVSAAFGGQPIYEMPYDTGLYQPPQQQYQQPMGYGTRAHPQQGYPTHQVFPNEAQGVPRPQRGYPPQQFFPSEAQGVPLTEHGGTMRNELADSRPLQRYELPYETGNFAPQ